MTSQAASQMIMHLPRDLVPRFPKTIETPEAPKPLTLSEGIHSGIDPLRGKLIGHLVLNQHPNLQINAYHKFKMHKIRQLMMPRNTSISYNWTRFFYRIVKLSANLCHENIESRWMEIAAQCNMQLLQGFSQSFFLGSKVCFHIFARMPIAK